MMQLIQTEIMTEVNVSVNGMVVRRGSRAWA